MRAVLAGLVAVAAGCGAAARAQDARLPEVTAEAFAEAHQRNAYATEAALKDRPFRFTGVPMAVTRGPDGLPRVTYPVSAGPTRVQAQIAKEAEGIAARIVPGEPLVLVCTGAADGMLFPFVTGCRAAAP